MASKNQTEKWSITVESGFVHILISRRVLIVEQSHVEKDLGKVKELFFVNDSQEAAQSVIMLNLSNLQKWNNEECKDLNLLKLPFIYILKVNSTDCHLVVNSNDRQKVDNDQKELKEVCNKLKHVILGKYIF